MAEPTDLRHDLDEVKNDVAELRKDVASLIEALQGAPRPESGPSTEATREGVHHDYDLRTVLDEVKQALREAERGGARTASAVESEIEQRPFLSAVIAFVVGLILGKLFSSS